MHVLTYLSSYIWLKLAVDIRKDGTYSFTHTESEVSGCRQPVELLYPSVCTFLVLPSISSIHHVHLVSRTHKRKWHHLCQLSLTGTKKTKKNLHIQILLEFGWKLNESDLINLHYHIDMLMYLLTSSFYI